MNPRLKRWFRSDRSDFVNEKFKATCGRGIMTTPFLNLSKKMVGSIVRPEDPPPVFNVREIPASYSNL